MSLLDSIKGMLGSRGGGAKRIDVEARFSRQRTAFTGTMANFFVAADAQRGGELVGVKVLDPEKVKAFEDRFKGLNKPSEGQIAIGMKHPRVVETYEYGVSMKGDPVIVMEYVSGPSMQTIVTQKQSDVIAGKHLMLIREMAESLRYVHDRGFIHRDICPRNFICLPKVEGVKLIDFGLTVPATPPFMTPGNRTGTPLYMSPEIVRRRATDKRVDLFSLGVTFYCMLAMRHPWQGEILNGRAALHHDTQPPKELTAEAPKVHPSLARAVMQMIQPNADDRTPDIETFLSSIRKLDHAFV